MTRHLIENQLQKKKYVLLILIDLSIAFDTLKTDDILPEKLVHYGSHPTTIKFFKAFFCNRKHQTEWFGETSETLDLSNYSCVQGSCLGPHIFNSYIRELPQVSNSVIIGFADDTNVIEQDNNPTSLIEKANKELETISSFMAANSLIINPQKTQAILFKPRNKPPIDYEAIGKLMINDKEIKIVDQAHYLGIIIDNKLSFKPQIKSLLKKLKNATNALLSTKKTLDRRSKIILYNSMFKSALDYAAVAYHDKINKKELNKISRLQKISIRLIFKAKPMVHTSPLFKMACIIPAEHTFRIEAIKLVYKCVNENPKLIQPTAIKEMLLNRTGARNSQRLNEDKQNIPLTRKNGLVYNILKCWNNASQELKNSGSIYSLNKQIKASAINDLEECRQANCHICTIDANVRYEN